MASPATAGMRSGDEEKKKERRENGMVEKKMAGKKEVVCEVMSGRRKG